MEDTLVLIERGLRRVIRLRAGRVRREQHKLSEREM